MLPVCLLLSAVCSLSVLAAEEESAAEKIKRYESYEKFFSNELKSQRPLVPDFRSEYNYIGGKRPSDKGYYYADKKARRQMEKKIKNRIEEWEDNNSVYTVCWSFSPFEGTGADIKAGKNNITYCIITSDFLDSMLSKAANKTEENLITFPGEFFPISLLGKRETLKKQFGSDVEDFGYRNNTYNQSDSRDRSNLPHIYILAVKRCTKQKLSDFYRNNIFKLMKEKIKGAAEGLNKTEKSEDANNSPTPDKASGVQQNLEIKMSMDKCILIISANTIAYVRNDGYNGYYPRQNGHIFINDEEWVNTTSAFPLKNKIDIKNTKLELDIQGFTVPLFSNAYPDFLVIKIGNIPDHARGKFYVLRFILNFIHIA